MSGFNIDNYEITTSIGDSVVNDDDDETVQPKIYPDISDLSTQSPEHFDDCKVLSEWILNSLKLHKNQHSSKIAIVEEIGETRCVTYEELYDGLKKTAKFMSHHGIKAGDRILLCMENSVEYVLYQLGVLYLRAVPVFVNPSHIASDLLQDIGCTTAIVDLDHYGHTLRVSKSFLRNIQRVFVLADDIAAVNVARHVWVIDAFGYLNFPSDLKRSEDYNSTAFILPGSCQLSVQYISHTQESAFVMCKNYFQQMFELIPNQNSNVYSHHLISNGFHCHDALLYFYYIIGRGETMLLTESTLDVWRASFLDRIAGIIEQYRVAFLFSNTQMLRCFIKYEVQKIYDMKHLKLIVNHGAALSRYTAKKIKNILDVVLIQAYSRAEFGAVSYGAVTDDGTDELIDCGPPVPAMHVKIAHLQHEKEMKTCEWGQIILSGPQLFASYLENTNAEEKFSRCWFKTGDYGMIDEKRNLHVSGVVADLIQAQGKQIPSELIEIIISQHKMVEDAVVMQTENEIWCGVLLKCENMVPTIEKLEKVLKKHGVILAIKKVLPVDFIPRSEDGNIIRKEIPYLMSPERNLQEEDTETSI